MQSELNGLSIIGVISRCNVWNLARLGVRRELWCACVRACVSMLSLLRDGRLLHFRSRDRSRGDSSCCLLLRYVTLCCTYVTSSVAYRAPATHIASMRRCLQHGRSGLTTRTRGKYTIKKKCGAGENTGPESCNFTAPSCPFLFHYLSFKFQCRVTEWIAHDHRESISTADLLNSGIPTAKFENVIFRRETLSVTWLDSLQHVCHGVEDEQVI